MFKKIWESVAPAAGAIFYAVLFFGTLPAIIFIAGCQSNNAEIQEQNSQNYLMVRMEWNGTKGWFIPDARLESIGLKMDELINERE